MKRWEPIIMAGIGAAAAQLDPGLPAKVLAVVVVKAFVGAAVGAYFGNHVHERRAK